MLGSHRQWTRDFALLGAISCAIIPTVATAGLVPNSWVWAFVPGAVVLGVLLGALVGAVARATAGRVAGAWPVGALLLLGPALGLTWGALVGGGASYFMLGQTELPWDRGLVMRDAAIGSGIAAAIQFGWFWLPYVIRRGRGQRIGGLWLVAIATSIALGALARSVSNL